MNRGFETGLLKKKVEPFSRILIFSACALALSAIYFFVDARYSNFLPRCPFFVLTRWYCPGCGSQRAWSALLHANINSAIHFNALFVVSLFAAPGFGLIYLLPVNVLNSKIQKTVFSPLGIKLFIITTIIFGVVRNIPVFPLTLLTP